MSVYVRARSDTGAASVDRETFCDERSNTLWIVSQPNFFFNSFAEVAPDAGRSVAAEGSF